MESVGWQSTAAIVCVAAAGIVLVRRTLGLWSNRSGSGCPTSGCAACPTSSSPDSDDGQLEEFVPIESLTVGDHVGDQ